MATEKVPLKQIDPAGAANDDVVQRKAGAWVNRTIAQLVTDIRTVLDSVYQAAGTYLTSANIEDAINDGTTTKAPSENAVFDALALKQPLDSDLTAIAGISPSNDDVIQRKAGAWINRTIAQLITDLRATLDTVYVQHSAATAANDFLVGVGTGAWIKKTLAQTVSILQGSFDAIYAPIAKGVTNGDSHDHTSGDGATLKSHYPYVCHGNDNTIAGAGSPTTAYIYQGMITGPVAAATSSLVSVSGTIKNLYFRVVGTQPASGSLVVTVQINGVDTAITVTAAAGSGTATLSDTTHTAAVTAGQQVTIKCVNNATAASINIRGISMDIEMEVFP